MSIVIVGDSGAGKSETIDAFNSLAADWISDLTIIFVTATPSADDAGLTLDINDDGTAAIAARRYGDAAGFMADAVDAFDTLGNQGCLAHCLDRVRRRLDLGWR